MPYTIDPNLNIHGLLLNIHCVNDKYQLIALETPDNILDFNKLKFDFTKTEYSFEQYREVLPRKNPANDPITKSCWVFSKGFNFSVAMRESGRFDLYWNFSLKESVDDSKTL